MQGSEIFMRTLINNCGSLIYPCLDSQLRLSTTKFLKILIYFEGILTLYEIVSDNGYYAVSFF